MSHCAQLLCVTRQKPELEIKCVNKIIFLQKSPLFKLFLYSELLMLQAECRLLYASQFKHCILLNLHAFVFQLFWGCIKWWTKDNTGLHRRPSKKETTNITKSQVFHLKFFNQTSSNEVFANPLFSLQR